MRCETGNDSHFLLAPSTALVRVCTPGLRSMSFGKTWLNAFFLLYLSRSTAASLAAPSFRALADSLKALRKTWCPPKASLIKIQRSYPLRYIQLLDGLPSTHDESSYSRRIFESHTINNERVIYRGHRQATTTIVDKRESTWKRRNNQRKSVWTTWTYVSCAV